MKTFSIASIILTFAITESVLAFCPVPLTSASKCCYYASSAGPDWTMENRYSTSLDNCIADAKYTNSILINSTQPYSSCYLYVPPAGLGTITYPASIVDIQERIETPFALLGTNVEWRQNFTHTYIAQTTVTDVFPPETFTYNCASFSGHLNWVVDPLPPPIVPCPIADLLPKPTDACSVALEAGFGTPAPASACKRSEVLDDPNGEPCLKRKLREIGITYVEPTSTYRTDGYQFHLKDLWYKYQSHTRYINRPEIYQACAPKRAVVTAEQYGPPSPGHRLGYEPMGSSHSGNAFDIDGATVEELKLAVPSVKAFLLAATPDSPACNLKWGGDFKHSLPDKFHFYTPPVN